MSIISILAIKTNTSMMFKACSVLLCNRLAHLYNSSSSGKAPNSWKSSRITPIFKKGDLSCAEYYKPISLLSLVRKIQERLVHQVLINYLLERNAISSYQFGLCPGCLALEALVSDPVLASDNGGGPEFCLFVFLTLPRPSTPYLITVLCMPFPRLESQIHYLAGFVTTLLTGLTFVALEGSASPSCSVNSGVPQGSILGPLLFILTFDGIFHLPLSCKRN